MHLLAIIPVTLCIVSQCCALLKNCVTEAEWEGDTSGTPRCEVVTPEAAHPDCFGSKDETEISVNRLPPDQQMQNNTPTIVCNASYPIDIDEVGFKFKVQPNIFFFRRSNGEGTKHSIVIPLYGNIWSPRWFIIRSIENPNLYTKFYLYYPGGNDRSLPFDWPHEKNFRTVVEPEGRFAVLPCQVTHRSDVIILKKNKCSTGEDFSIEADNQTVRFEPKDGFIIDTWAEFEDSVYGVYTCTARNPRKSKTDLETLQVTLRKPKDFTATPDLSNMYFFYGDTVELRCKSSKAVTMSGSFNGRRIPPQNFTYSENSSLRSPYAAKFLYEQLVGSDYGDVTCLNSIGTRHTWTFHTLDLENNRHLQFTNNGTMVRCSSGLSSYITIFNTDCFNEAHCRSRQNAIEAFGSGQCDLKIQQLKCAYKCHRQHPDKCMDVKQTRRSGIYKCETEDLAKRISYLIGYDGKIHTDIRDLSKIPTDAIIQILNPTGLVYTNTNHTFFCQASSFISNGEFQWRLRAPNGTEYPGNILDVFEQHDFLTTNDSIWGANILFDSTMDGLELICLVPIWNTRDDWLTNSVIVDVVFPVKPEIDESEPSTQTYYIGDANKFIPCNGSGQPPPLVKWYKDGQPVHRNMTEKGGTELVFQKINRGIEGIYTCVAMNPGGNTTRQYVVSVERKPNVTIYIVVGVLLLTGFMVGLAVLYWKLRDAKKRIRNLTDEEVDEFLHGNAEAAKAAKEPLEVIMYLPFNPEYEISKDRLNFDEQDILGSGAYGVVLRGKLSGYPEEVAIKMLKPHSTLSYFKALLSELKIMVYLGKHENVVQLIGAYTGKIKERVLYMVVELSPYGNLEDFLRNQSKNFQNQIKDDAISIPRGAFTRFYANFTPTAVDNPMYVSVLCTSDLVSMSHQIAEGMQHLASKKVIHADLACRNVLLYNTGVVKITDFGLSRQLYAYTSYMKKEQEPLPWRSMAIESLREMNFSTQSDVWAYGVTLWEIFSLGAVPYPGLAWSIDFVDKLVQGLRLSKPFYATTEIYEIMLQCWQTNSENRPTFVELRDVFYTMRNHVEKLME